jgi:hypothetical protein
VQAIVDVSSDETRMRTEKAYVNKLNLVLVQVSYSSHESFIYMNPNTTLLDQILKQAWPHDWPSFIPEIVASSKTNLSLCENNMIILKLLSEEIFDYSAEQMTQAKTKNLKNQGDSGDPATLLELDSPRLHLRNLSYRHAGHQGQLRQVTIWRSLLTNWFDTLPVPRPARVQEHHFEVFV